MAKTAFCSCSTVSFHLFHLDPVTAFQKATCTLYNKHPDNAAVYAFCHKKIVLFTCHRDSDKQDYDHCGNLSNMGRHPACGDSEHNCLPACVQCSILNKGDAVMKPCHQGLWLVGRVGALWQAGKEAARQAVQPSGGRGVCEAAVRYNILMSESHRVPVLIIYLHNFLTQCVLSP